MFVYFVNYYNWSDSVYYPVTHVDEFSKEEFKDMCDKASGIVAERIMKHNQDIYLDSSCVSKYDLLDGIVEVLCSDFGFSRLDILCYDLDDKLVDVHNRL